MVPYKGRKDDKKASRCPGRKALQHLTGNLEKLKGTVHEQVAHHKISATNKDIPFSLGLGGLPPGTPPVVITTSVDMEAWKPEEGGAAGQPCPTQQEFSLSM